MKRILKWTAAILLLLAVLFVIFLQARDYNSYRHRIPAGADIIIRISVDDILTTMAWDFITHPAISSRKKEKTAIDTISKGSGIYIPANIFLYTLKGRSNSTFFCSLPVTDTVQLRKFIQEQLGITPVKSTGNGVFRAISKDNGLSIAYNNENVALAYSLVSEEVWDALESIIEGKNMRPVSDKRIGALQATKGHVLYSDENNNTGRLAFEDGKITINARLMKSTSFNVEEKVKHRKFSDNSIAKLWFDGSFTGLNNTLNFFDYELAADSLFPNGHVAFDLELGDNTVTIKDSVVSYGYNDDFEKTEEWSVVDKEVPGIIFTLQTSSGKKLLQYFQGNNLIQNGKVNKEVFPLYPLVVSEKEGAVYFSTRPDPLPDYVDEWSDYFCCISVNLDKIKSQKLFPFLSPYIDKMTFFELKARRAGQQHILLEGTLHFNKKNINALSQTGL